MSTVLENPVTSSEELANSARIALAKLQKHYPRFKVGILSQIGSQIWSCLECDQERQWGWWDPEDPMRVPELGCPACGKVTPHGFLRTVRGRMA